MQKCCLVGCDKDSSKGVSDYCEPHRREKERQLMDNTGFRNWYNDQPYKGERLAFNAWQASEKRSIAGVLEFIEDYRFTLPDDLIAAIKEKFGLEDC